MVSSILSLAIEIDDKKRKMKQIIYNKVTNKVNKKIRYLRSRKKQQSNYDNFIKNKTKKINKFKIEAGNSVISEILLDELIK